MWMEKEIQADLRGRGRGEGWEIGEAVGSGIGCKRESN